MKKIHTLCAIAIAALSLTACNKDSSTNNASTSNSSDVEARQALMKDWRGANDIIKGMLENPANFDAATLKEQTAFLADSAKMWGHFADQNAKGDSQDAVWTDAAGFKAAADKFDAATAALNAAAQTATSVDDIKAQAGQVGESCGSCHKVYKK